MMRLIRYNQIKDMLRERSKKALISEPRGYGYGQWHQAIVELAGEIENQDRLEKMDIIVGEWLAPKNRSKLAIKDIIEMDAVHCHLTQDEFRQAVKMLMKHVKPPISDNPELVAVEQVADQAVRNLEQANRRIAELEEANAKLQSTSDLARPTP